jgi:hypothetical protein
MTPAPTALAPTQPDNGTIYDQDSVNFKNAKKWVPVQVPDENKFRTVTVF